MDAQSTLLLMRECTADIRRTILSSRALIDETRKMLAEVDGKLGKNPIAGGSAAIRDSHASRPIYELPAEQRTSVERGPVSQSLRKRTNSSVVNP